MKSALISPLLAGLLLLTGCAQPAAQAGGGGGGTIDAINHTKWAINHFSINGQSGIDSIGPFQGGGGGCCFSVPARWTPGMTVRVDWETGQGSSAGFPGFADRAKYKAWIADIDAQKRQHSQTVPCLTITARMCAALRCTFYPAMT
ncbi:membrane protein [Klebsiella pneumoniae]|nr:membrane protein [Klebsiella pneumoniae]